MKFWLFCQDHTTRIDYAVIACRSCIRSRFDCTSYPFVAKRLTTIHPTMKIDRLLLIGIVTLAFLIVTVTTYLLTKDMLKMAETNLADLHSVSESVKDQNEDMFNNMNKQVSQVNRNIYGITEKAAIEQLRNVGDGISEEIKAVMNMPFASIQAVAKTLLFEKTESERLGETPSRERIEQYLIGFLQQSDEVRALFCAWEKNAFDGKDDEFIGKENPDEDMDRGNEDYVSEGAFLPWFYKSEDENGKEKIVRAFLDDYLISDTKYYVGPRDSKKEFITEPYIDAGIPITSFCVPILKDDQVIGVAGLDVALNKLQEIVEQRKPFETGFAMFFSPEGQIVYYPDKNINYKEVPHSITGELELNYRELADVPELAETAEHIKTKKPVIYTSTTLPGRERTEMLVIHIPVQFGDYPEIWTVAVAAPAEKVMQHRNQASHDMDDMLVALASQNKDFVGKLDDHIGKTVEASEQSKSDSFWRSILIGLVVLAISVAVGSYFAFWVNRSINARDFRYRQILDASSDPMSVVDMQGKIAFLNKQALTLLGKTQDECLGQLVDDLWRPVIGRDYSATGIRVLQTKGEKVSQTKFNGSNWDITSDYIVDAKNSKDGMVEIFKDVTDRESIYRLVGRVDELIKATVEQTTNIAQAATDLSRGAAQQAESVQSITGDMRTANDQSQKNAASADQANQLSDDAAQAASLGQQRMQEMVGSMNQISDNARNMQAVIRTIDDIAFQTNLLALNAAVEAARAGTHGKGFAVVAEEVRNLAARSAKAAKETEELIIKSSQQIEGGVTVADQTAEALNAIAQHVGEVSSLIQQIAVASKEQTVGVNRMTTTLQTVDQITQQNVELASTTANATQMLSGEVNELQELMGHLRKKDK